jgi:hypothetical protein
MHQCATATAAISSLRHLVPSAPVRYSYCCDLIFKTLTSALQLLTSALQLLLRSHLELLSEQMRERFRAGPFPRSRSRLTLATQEVYGGQI